MAFGWVKAGSVDNRKEPLEALKVQLDEAVKGLVGREKRDIYAVRYHLEGAYLSNSFSDDRVCGCGERSCMPVVLGVQDLKIGWLQLRKGDKCASRA